MDIFVSLKRAIAVIAWWSRLNGYAFAKAEADIRANNWRSALIRTADIGWHFFEGPLSSVLWSELNRFCHRRKPPFSAHSLRNR